MNLLCIFDTSSIAHAKICPNIEVNNDHESLSCIAHTDVRCFVDAAADDDDGAVDVAFAAVVGAAVEG